MMARLRGMRFTRQLLLLQIGLVTLVVGIGFGLVAWLLDQSLEHQYEQRALNVARTVATEQHLGDLVRAGDQPAVQELAMAASRATGALFVVVTDARGKVPVRDSAGAIVGEVSVGFDAADIRRALLDLIGATAPFAVGALLLGVAGSTWLSRVLKRRTFGLEPADLADLVREREAVLHGISEGVLAVDTDRRVTMYNDEAVRLLDRPVRVGMSLGELDLPPRLSSALEGDRADNILTVAGDRVLVANHRPVHRDGRDLGGVLTLRDRTDLEQLTSELDAVRSMTGALRAQRHEFANRMHTVLGLLQVEAHDDALEYLRAVTQFQDADLISESPAVRSATIRSFMAAKTARAAELGVSLKLSEESWVQQRLVAPVEVVTVLGNLVDNALDAAHASTRRPGIVEVDLLSDGTRLVISVANTGDGVSPTQTEAIFVEGISSRGTDRGLGLAIARQTARGLGGDITLANPGCDGSETVFVAQLPDVLEETIGVALPDVPEEATDLAQPSDVPEEAIDLPSDVRGEAGT